MSCNITAGISTGCNDQIGGIVGIHYMEWYPDLTFDKDANGVITRVYRASTPNSSEFFDFIDCRGGGGSVTETYNVGGTGNILGFHQAAQFFMPTTANLLFNTSGETANYRIGVLAAQNNLVIGIETQDNGPMQSYSKKCFVFGLERPAYCASGNKETGITYTDNNGYTLELAADSKTPMQEIAYMAMHSNNLTCEKALPSPGSTDYSWTNGNFFSLERLVNYEGGNIRRLTPTLDVWPEIYLQPGELLTVEAIIAMDFGPNAFSGTTFLPEWEISPYNATLSYTDLTNFPLPTTPGPDQVLVKGTYENTTSSVQSVIPIKLAAPTGIDISGGSEIPFAKFLTITRST